MALFSSFIPVTWLGFRALWRVPRHPSGLLGRGTQSPTARLCHPPIPYIWWPLVPHSCWQLLGPRPGPYLAPATCLKECALLHLVFPPPLLAPSLPLLLRVPSAGGREDAPDPGPVGHREKCL